MRKILIAILVGFLTAGLGYAEQNKDAAAKGETKEMKRALLVIDVQNEYFTGKLPVTHPPRSLENIVRAMEHARQNQIPVVVIQHTSPQKDAVVFRKGSKEWDLHLKIASQAYDHMIEKNFPGSFTGTDLESWLRERKVDTVVISGYMTQMCCDATARQAAQMGLIVEFLSDATGTLSVANNVKAEEIHQATLKAQAMLHSKVMTTDQWLESIK